MLCSMRWVSRLTPRFASAFAGKTSMTLRRVKFLLLLRTSHVLLRLHSWVLAAVLRASPKSKPTSSHLAERAEQLRSQLQSKHLHAPQLSQHLLRSREPRNNLNFSQKPHRGLQMSIQHLTSKEIEQAFAVVDAAWKVAQGLEVEVSVPEHLQHLSPEDWESVSRVLYLLKHQQSASALH
jgi:hypothetical protein